jgi:IMP cyclohydrolase
MLEMENRFLVSNGDQTRTLYEGLARGGTMSSSLSRREREPDAPNYTPRITGLLDLSGEQASIGLSILKANRINPELTDRHYFYPDAPCDGIGYGLTTYMGDGNPLPTFEGDPLLLPLMGTAEETLEAYWNALDEDNRISLAVKEISLDGSSSRIVFKNKY